MAAKDKQAGAIPPVCCFCQYPFALLTNDGLYFLAADRPRSRSACGAIWGHGGNATIKLQAKCVQVCPACK